MLHQSTEKALKQQVLHVKVTKQFRAALLIDGKDQSVSTAATSCEKVSAHELGINQPGGCKAHPKKNNISAKSN